jgi:outer membrane receptor protein involved in Fe transport
MADQKIFQQLKLRASAGVVGNQGIENYGTLGMLAAVSNMPYSTGTYFTGYWGQDVGTPDLRWERTQQYDIGLDFSLWDQRLNLTIDWYQKNTTDLLYQQTIPSYNGGRTYWGNVGAMQNSGWEFSANVFPVRGDFTWETTLNATYLHNEVKSLGDDLFLNGTTPYSGSFLPCTRLVPGYPVGVFWVLDYIGMDANGANLYRKADGTETTNPETDDKVLMGNANPAWQFGWNNMVYWGNWEANVFISAVTGVNRINLLRSFIMNAAMPTAREGYLNSWDYLSAHGGNTADAEYSSRLNTESKRRGDSSQWLEDAKFLRLKNVSIAYRIPRKIVKFADIRLSVSAQNLFVLTPYKGLDPESLNALMGTAVDNIDLNNGMDIGSFPQPRTFTFGLKLDF